VQRARQRRQQRGPGRERGAQLPHARALRCTASVQGLCRCWVSTVFHSSVARYRIGRAAGVTTP